MNRRASLFVVGILVAALIGVALLAVPGSPVRQEPTLGLDLQGGLEVTLQAVPPPTRVLTDEDLDLLYATRDKDEYWRLLRNIVERLEREAA